MPDHKPGQAPDKYCSYCGFKQVDPDATVCQNCGKPQWIKNSLTHWLSIIQSVIAFYIIGASGSNPEFSHIHILNYISLFFAVGAVVTALVLIPKELKGLYRTSLIIAIIMTLAGISRVLF